jgi:anti-sigma-K factor RskA
MSQHDHSPWEDDLAAYALDALAGDERRAFEDHLASCDRCRTELRWLVPAVDVLPAAVEQHEPPPRLRERILTEVAKDVEREDPGAARAERPQRSRWSLGALRPALTGAVAAVALGAGLAGGYLLAGDEGTETVTVPVQAAAPASQARAAVIHDGEFWKLDVSQMPGLRRGDVYQVWLRDGERILPSVLFVLSHGNRATVALPRRITASADQLMVTREPSGGSQAPTSAPMLSAELQ